MTAYVVRRILQSIPVLFFVSLVVFLLMHMLPGDPVRSLIPVGESALEEEQREKTIQLVRKRYGFDKPVPIQYFQWVGNALRGDLGKSVRTKRGVTEMIIDRLPVTATLAAVSWVISMTIAVPAGVIAAIRRNSMLDVGATVTTMAGVAMPSFWLGILLILVFTWWWRVLPAPGAFVPVWEDPIKGLKLLILPAIALGVTTTASVMRLTRSSMLEVLAQDYIRTARAKGLRERSVIWLHGLKNAMLPVVTVMGLQMIAKLSGTVIIEQMFAIPGLGRMALGAIYGRDYPVVQGFVLFIATLVITFNLLVDITYAYLDPRIRYTR